MRAATLAIEDAIDTRDSTALRQHLAMAVTWAKVRMTRVPLAVRGGCVK
jgi:hypothetical protein